MARRCLPPWSGRGVNPQSTSRSTPQPSAVRKNAPVLYRLRMLSSTTITGIDATDMPHRIFERIAMAKLATLTTETLEFFRPIEHNGKRNRGARTNGRDEQ